MLNKAEIIGNLGRDPELRYTATQNAVTNLSVASEEWWRDEDGKEQKRTEWHRVVLFRKLAETACKHLHKGSLVYLEGRLQTRKWQDKDGIDRYTTEIVAGRMRMLGGNGGQANAGQNPQEPTQEAATASGEGAVTDAEPPDFDDDIPF